MPTWKGVEYELTTPSMLLKIINSVDESKDGKYHPYGRFLAYDAPLWVAEWERDIISERTKEALRAKKEKGVVLGRPSAKLPIHTIALMRVAGKSWSSISLELRIPRSTLKNYRKEIEEECIKVAESLYKKCPSCGSFLSYVPDMNYWCCTNCNYLEGRQ